MVRIGRCFHSNTFLEAQNYLSNISATCFEILVSGNFDMP
jgi:hypothetical protein